VVAEEYALEANDTAAPSSFGMTSAFEQRRLQHVKQTMSKARLAMVSPRLGLLNNIPFVISFEHRVQIFRMFVANDRKRNDIYDFIRPHAEARIRRDHVFEDGFNQLYKLGPDLKKKIAILFIDSFGIEESGIDGGGVFKEFLTR
jgi:ubiquitin-protein ligase E3 C